MKKSQTYMQGVLLLCLLTTALPVKAQVGAFIPGAWPTIWGGCPPPVVGDAFQILYNASALPPCTVPDGAFRISVGPAWGSPIFGQLGVAEVQHNLLAIPPASKWFSAFAPINATVLRSSEGDLVISATTSQQFPPQGSPPSTASIHFGTTPSAAVANSPAADQPADVERMTLWQNGQLAIGTAGILPAPTNWEHDILYLHLPAVSSYTPISGSPNYYDANQLMSIRLSYGIWPNPVSLRYAQLGFDRGKQLSAISSNEDLVFSNNPDSPVPTNVGDIIVTNRRLEKSIRFGTTTAGDAAPGPDVDLQRMIIDNKGRVGIGVANPQIAEMVDVHYNLSAHHIIQTPLPALRITQDLDPNHTGSTDNTYRNVILGLAPQGGDWGPTATGDAILESNSGDMQFVNSSNPADAPGASYTPKLGDFDFWTVPVWGQAAQLRLIVKNGGNVGIGTAVPAQTLDVAGTFPQGSLKFSGMLMPNGLSGNSGDVLISGGTTTPPVWTNIATVMGGWSLLGNTGTTPGNNFVGTVDAQDVVLKAHGFEQLRLTSATLSDGSDGKVVIGGWSRTGVLPTATSPLNLKLLVNGSMVAKEIWTSVGWSDFVFGDKYALMPLQDLEKSIATNKHLPGIPSEAEVQQHGFSVGEIDAKLLQKVEELTLYVIQQDKRIRELEESNQRLAK